MRKIIAALAVASMTAIGTGGIFEPLQVLAVSGNDAIDISSAIHVENVTQPGGPTVFTPAGSGIIYDAIVPFHGHSLADDTHVDLVAITSLIDFSIDEVFVYSVLQSLQVA